MVLISFIYYKYLIYIISLIEEGTPSLLDILYKL